MQFCISILIYYYKLTNLYYMDNTVDPEQMASEEGYKLFSIEFISGFILL